MDDCPVAGRRYLLFFAGFLLFLVCVLPQTKAHENHVHAEEQPESTTVPGDGFVSPSETIVAPAVRHNDWDDPFLIGTVATVNTADLPRTPKAQNFFPTEIYDNCKASSAEADKADEHYIRNIISNIVIRDEPFPGIVCFMHEADYYARRDVLQKKIAAYIEQLPDSDQVQALENYAWLLMYLGEFNEVLALFGPSGQYNPVAEQNGSIIFAISQAYFRLGQYREAYPYGVRANRLLTDSVLDTRWHVMLIELGLQGRRFLDEPDSSIFEKSSIRSLFPYRDWESFPFEDVTEAMGIDRWGGTGSISFIDLDNDNWDELVWERKYMPPQVYKNLKGKAFRNIPAEDLVASLGSPIIFSAGDMDNDGRPDLFRHCCNYDGPGPTQVLKNMGDLTFKDITEPSGLAHNEGSGMVVAWSDYDLDGFLDIVIADNWGPNRLYRNRGDGTYENTTARAGLRTKATVGISFGDYNNDGWPDIWAQGWDAKWLYRNNQDGTFTDVSEEAGLGEQLGQKGYMSFMFDYNNDGHMDLFAGQYVVSSDEKWGFGPICTCSNLLADEGYSEREWRSATTIFKNNGDGTFTNIAESSRFIPLGMMGSNHGDWNNDGYEDLLFGAGGPYMQQAEPFLFYENNGDDTFTNITPFEMLSLFGKGHGSAFTDFDHDGFLDVATNNGGAAPGDLWPSLLLRNKGNDNHWLRVKLKAELPDTNAMAVGARVTLYAGDMLQVKEVQSGGQFGATNSLVLHFGLAKHTAVDKVVIRWPNRDLQETVIENLDANQEIEVSQRTGKYRVLWAKPPAILNVGKRR